MVEKRRAMRMPVDLSLEISTLFKQDHVNVTNINRSEERRVGKEC